VTLSLDPSTSGQGGRQFHVRVLHRSYHEPTNMVMRIRNSSEHKKIEKIERKRAFSPQNTQADSNIDFRGSGMQLETKGTYLIHVVSSLIFSYLYTYFIK